MLLTLVALAAAAVSAFECPTISDEAQSKLASVCIGDDAGLCGRGFHSSTSQLNLSAFCGIGGARRGYVAHLMGLLGGV
jgi:hypothetical protein